VAVVAALAGALAGERLEAPVESWINQALMIVGLAGLVLGPYLVISVCYEHTARRDHRLRGTTAWRDLASLASLSQTGRGRGSDVDSAGGSSRISLAATTAVPRLSHPKSATTSVSIFRPNTVAVESTRRCYMSTLTVTDDRTGKQYKVPIQNGAIPAMELRKIKVSEDDFGLM